MKRRGLDDADIELVQVDPFSAGYFNREVEKGRRLVSAVSYWRRDAKDNGYAHPIEGVVALVDLIEDRVVQLVDEPNDRSRSRRQSRNYDRASIPRCARTSSRSTSCRRTGPSFYGRWLEGRLAELVVPRRLDRARGPGAASDLVSRWRRERPIIYRASVTDMIVPYADPTANHFWKSAFDAGEYGLGKLANALELGCDCLGHIHYFDVPAADDFGKPAVDEERDLPA